MCRTSFVSPQRACGMTFSHRPSSQAALRRLRSRLSRECIRQNQYPLLPLPRYRSNSP